jgi:hypothetical protein
VLFIISKKKNATIQKISSIASVPFVVILVILQDYTVNTAGGLLFPEVIIHPVVNG